MPRAQANGIEIEYEVRGDDADPVLLLIMGFTAQMTQWHDDFVQAFVDKGFRVVRFDNRDVGLSSRVEGTYSLDDMADDAAGLLDALGIGVAHVVGASMGGMIAQTFALRHPAKTLSLCSIMSTTGDPQVGQPSPEALSALLQPPPTTREEALGRAVAVQAVIGSKTMPMTDEEVTERAGRAWDRLPDHDYAGNGRQLHAIQTQLDRTAALGSVTVPTLVVHGRHDPLVTLSGGEATAAAVPGSELLVLDDMAHDLPRPLWPQIVDAIVTNTKKAEVAA